MKKIFHLYKKVTKSNCYYGSLAALCKENKDLMVSKSKLDKWDFNSDFENGLCKIIKSNMKSTGDVSNTNELLSGNNGITLLDNSKLRSMFSVEIAKLTLSYADESIIENIKISSLLHGIGLCCNIFQKDIKNPNKKTKVKFLYNEIGWAFITKHLHEKGYEFILDSIYWSNGITTNKNKKMNGYNNNNVLDTVDESDKLRMREFLKEILPITEYNNYHNDIKVDAPIYYSKSDSILNSKKTFIRTCVISADKLISSLEVNKLQNILEKQDLNEIRRLIDGLTKRDFHKQSLVFDDYDSKRLHTQKDILESCDKTTIVNAPSGFGKSLIGVLWNLMYSNKKLIWVCPRNAVAQSAYINILNELNSLGVSDKVSVELYLTGKTIKTNSVGKNTGGFNSDIIVTNIDNFLRPSINMNNAERLFFINNCDVVFDEYHELVKEDGLFAGFINIMNTRHKFTNSRTILLSATPLKINNLWDSINIKTKILPSDDSHYPAAHKNKYELYTYTLENIDTFNVKQKTSSVTVFNSISNSQIIHNQIGSGQLVHSNFCSADKDKIFDNIYDKFDKNSSRFLSKENITATHVIQASLDISFLNLYESVLSPLSTLQRIGRCDRWGDYDKQPKISIYQINDRGENKLKDILYTKSLSDKWFDFISMYNGKQINLDKLYEIYNDFHKINSIEVNKYIENCHDKSLQNFMQIFPKHYKGNKKEETTFRAGANKLRNIGSEIFFICKLHNSEKYSDIVSDNNYSHFKGYDEDKTTFSRMIKAMKSIRNMKDERYDYSELIDEYDIDVIRDASKESDTPYIRFDVVYHKEYGVIKKSVLNQVNSPPT